MSKDVRTQRQHKRILGYRHTFLALSPEEQDALDSINGYKSTLDWRDPPMQPSPKEMQSKGNRRKRERRQRRRAS